MAPAAVQTLSFCTWSDSGEGVAARSVAATDLLQRGGRLVRGRRLGTQRALALGRKRARGVARAARRRAAAGRHDLLLLLLRGLHAAARACSRARLTPCA